MLTKYNVKKFFIMADEIYNFLTVRLQDIR